MVVVVPRWYLLQFHLSSVHTIQAILTVITNKEFDDLVRVSKNEGTDLLKALRAYVPTLSAHQQKKIDRHVRDIIIESGTVSITISFWHKFERQRSEEFQSILKAQYQYASHCRRLNYY